MVTFDISVTDSFIEDIFCKSCIEEELPRHLCRNIGIMDLRKMKQMVSRVYAEGLVKMGNRWTFTCKTCKSSKKYALK